MAYDKEEIETILRVKMPFKDQSKLMESNARKSNSKLRPDGYIYILKQKGFDIYKIGVSSAPKRRIKDIDSSNPFGVDVVCLEYFKNVYNIEECIHDSFKGNLLRKEWFRLHKDDIVRLKRQLNKMSKNGFYLNRK